MIITLTGRVTHKAKDYVVVDAAGIGYQVFMSRPSLLALVVGTETSLWLHHHIREDANDMFGFLSSGDRELFVRLLDISGVGPKAALSITSLGSAKQIEDAIERSDVGFLSSASGVGKKTAQKIVLELKGKLVNDEMTDGNSEVLVALVNLGYNRDHARDALAKIGSEGNVEDRLRKALRELGK